MTRFQLSVTLAGALRRSPSSFVLVAGTIVGYELIACGGGGCCCR